MTLLALFFKAFVLILSFKWKIFVNFVISKAKQALFNPTLNT